MNVMEMEVKQIINLLSLYFPSALQVRTRVQRITAAAATCVCISLRACSAAVPSAWSSSPT